MIYTSSHSNYQSTKFRGVAISGNRGKDASFIGECFKSLAPKLSFWKIWHQNIGTILEEENNRYYIEEYYKQVLKHLDPEEIYKELDGSILLCYEKSSEFCHRHIVAEWFFLTLGIKVPEVKVRDDKIEEQTRPEYIRTYLEKVIQNENQNKIKENAPIKMKSKIIKF